MEKFSLAPSRLALPLSPQPDEVFTSWLVRLAAAHGLPTGAFCNLIAGGKTEFNRDMDGPTCERILVALAALTGFRAERLRQEHTFGGFGGRLFPQARTTTANRWVLPVGTVVNRKPALQFCTACLAADKTPYFRRAWRLSLFAVCPVHAVRLRHLCPECSAVISPVRGHLRHELGATPLCWQCRSDLRGAPGELVAERDAGFARQCHKTLYEGVASLCNSPRVSTGDYLDALAIVCTRLTCLRERLRQWRGIVATMADAELPAPVQNRGTAAFDSLADPASRLPVLRTAGWLLEGWPERFLDVARRANTRTSDFLPDFAAAPEWFLEPIRLHLTPASHAMHTAGVVRPKSQKEVILSLRDAWIEHGRHRIVRALRDAGFYDDTVADKYIQRYIRRTIATLQIQEKRFRRQLTRQIPRNTTEWLELRRLARPYRKDKCNSTEEIQRGIRLLCENYFLSAYDLSELLGRCQDVLKAKHLTIMVREGWLETRFGPSASGLLNNPQQAYRSVVAL